MTPQSTRFDLHLNSHDAKRLVEALHVEALSAQYVEGELVFHDPGLCTAVREWHGKLSTFNRLIREMAKREGGRYSLTSRWMKSTWCSQS